MVFFFSGQKNGVKMVASGGGAATWKSREREDSVKKNGVKNSLFKCIQIF